jgi:hypothetical protein
MDWAESFPLSLSNQLSRRRAGNFRGTVLTFLSTNITSPNCTSLSLHEYYLPLDLVPPDRRPSYNVNNIQPFHEAGLESESNNLPCCSQCPTRSSKTPHLSGSENWRWPSGRYQSAGHDQSPRRRTWKPSQKKINPQKPRLINRGAKQPYCTQILGDLGYA